MKPYFLRFHRWIALLFSLPLLAIVLTGLVLSFEPWFVTRAIQPGQLSAARVEELVTAQGGQARGVSYRSYDGTLTIGGGRGARGVIVDVATGDVAQSPSRAAAIFGTARGLHETLLLDLRWLVTTSTVAMTVVMLLGIVMGWPRFANTLGGWHRGVAWVLLPLLLLSPITGLMMSAGITFSGNSASAVKSPPVSLVQAIRALGKDHDLSGLVWLRPQGDCMVARIAEGGEYKLYAVNAAQLAAALARRQLRRRLVLDHEYRDFSRAADAADDRIPHLAATAIPPAHTQAHGGGRRVTLPPSSMIVTAARQCVAVHSGECVHGLPAHGAHGFDRIAYAVVDRRYRIAFIDRGYVRAQVAQ